MTALVGPTDTQAKHTSWEHSDLCSILNMEGKGGIEPYRPVGGPPSENGQAL